MIKVADFGLSESLGDTKDYFRQRGDDNVKLPIKWLAIESINDGIFSEKTDVVSEDHLRSLKSGVTVTIIVGLWRDMLGGV